MKRILSIDWDYYINASADERFDMFPDGGNEYLPTDLQNYIWQTRYEYYQAELTQVDLLPEYKRIKEFAKNSKRVMVFDSHKNLYGCAMALTKPTEKFSLVNIDFHHDLYNFRKKGEIVNCGNWGNVLKERRPNMQMSWCRREDSEEEVLGGKIDIPVMTGIPECLYEQKYDLLFICRSPVWSPPHLDDRLLEVIEECSAQPCNMLVMDKLFPRRYVGEKKND